MCPFILPVGQYLKKATFTTLLITSYKISVFYEVKNAASDLKNVTANSIKKNYIRNIGTCAVEKI
jgi:hypothetical protein